jgi:hypothetical protein
MYDREAVMPNQLSDMYLNFPQLLTRAFELDKQQATSIDVQPIGPPHSTYYIQLQYKTTMRLGEGAYLSLYVRL